MPSELDHRVRRLIGCEAAGILCGGQPLGEQFSTALGQRFFDLGPVLDHCDGYRLGKDSFEYRTGGFLLDLFRGLFFGGIFFGRGMGKPFFLNFLCGVTLRHL
ncbi:hypothetical protein AKO51_15490 [Brucella abortus]|nr:hypothetical protein BFS01_04715 [Brucella sp. 2002734562]KFJ46027.1 hypothetical protein DK47_690 [Brucella abortus 2308]KFJ62810.1 hypothetical protein DK59_3029 [Brucella abortus bv. 4 str. 292]KPZ78705.1 hypothetical protein AKO52_15435 [Brucella abortus]KPZ78862.1 hypothetical protein AKO51_15490 [Brucella abortus]